jgi:hypothetical protein
LRSGDIERGADLSAPGICAERLTEFVPGDGDGLDHGLAEIGECGGEFGFYIAAGDGAEDASHGAAEIASGKQFCWKEARYVLADLFCREAFGFLLGMEVTEMQMAGAARSAALAAIGKGEGAQVGGTVLLAGGRRATCFLCGHTRASRAFRGHRSLLKS